jgi:drug/metabolite transporter (DMT)-like permease
MVGPLLYAMTNHIDKVMLENYFQDHGVLTLILFSSLLSAVGLPILYFIDPTALAVPVSSIAKLFVVGALNLLVLWAYLMALKDDEATIVIIYYSLVPVLGGIFGYIFLDEQLGSKQVWAMIVVIVGTSLVSFELGSERKFSFRKNTVVYMLIATTAWASEATIFKHVALEESVWRSVFWEHASLVFFGIVIFVFATNHRKQFLSVWVANSRKVLALNGANEAIYMVGNMTVSYAMLLAPIALILLAQSFQPVFVFLVGAIMTFFLPNIFNERLTAAAITQKLVAIVLSGTGAYWLVLSTP